MLNIEEIYERAVELLKKDKNIIFDNILYPQLAVSEHWWYAVMLKDEQKKQTIKSLMMANKSKNTTDGLKKLSKLKDTAGITAFLKINNESCRRALSTVREEIVQVDQDKESSRDELLARLDELENE